MEIKNRKKRWFVVALVVLLLGVVFFLKDLLWSGFDVDKTTYLYITKDKNYKQLEMQLADSTHIRSMWLFNALASATHYPEKMRSGRYAVKPGDGILTVFRKLRNGSQDPVTLTFNNIRTKQELIDKIGGKFAFGKQKFRDMLNNTGLYSGYGLDTNTVVTLFIPNTYEIYWNVGAEAFMKKMEAGYKRFWNPERVAKLQNAGLTKTEVMTLASIVEEECHFVDEYPMVAGLYLNRLHSGQPLQADPTVKFALNNFALRRILLADLKVNSPYNTYIHTGLPPGPIRIPSAKAVDGVLNYTHHNYLYMCAKDDFSGRHNFATTFSEHQANARNYQKALNERDIMK